MRTSPVLPYWLDGGTETCSVCTHVHVYEMTFRCVACDRGICCHCVSVRVTSRESFCAACEAEQDEGHAQEREV
jgi:hypothetical protein